MEFKAPTLKRDFDLSQDTNIPTDYSIRKWRRSQIQKFLDRYPLAQGSIVEAQIHNHEPNPQPEANVRAINKILRNLRKTETEESNEGADISLENETLHQDYNKPNNCGTSKQRRDQVKKFLDQNPDCKGREVKLWLQSHKSDP